MARRKDHSPEELRELILKAAEKLVFSKGFNGLTARALAAAIGYAPGTIYNFYKDMDAVLTDINFGTLGRLQVFCRESLSGLPADFSRVRALAYAYVDFAHQNRRAWETIFAFNRKGASPSRLPKSYSDRLEGLFLDIETVLRESLPVPASDVRKTSRLLWACLHGITVLTIDGRMKLVGIESSHDLIDELLERQLAIYS